MTGPFDADDAATQLTPAERTGLIAMHVALRGEMYELEQRTIAAADRGIFIRNHNVLTEPFLRGLYHRMFNRVWHWAGQYRKFELNLGVASYRILSQLLQIIGDARYWIDRQSWAPDELALRLRHRLVFVHPIPNSNGRGSRLAANILVVRQGRDRFT